MDRLSRQLSLCLSVCARVSCFSLCIFCLLGSRVWVWGAMHAFMMLAAESLLMRGGWMHVMCIWVLFCGLQISIRAVAFL
jgi:hypothetical protein